MEQRILAQIGVDQRNDDADLGESDPGGDELRTIVHVETDHVAALEAIQLEVIGDAIGEFVDLLERPVAVLEYETGLLGMLDDERLEDFAER